MSAAEMSGLELLQGIFTGAIPPGSFTDLVPVHAGSNTSVSRGRVVFESMADHRHLNPMGGVHGGFAATLLDSVTGCAVMSMLESGVTYATVDLNVKMVQPVPQNCTLVVEGNALHVSKSIGVAEGSIKDESGKLLAHGTATLVLKRD